MSYVICFVCLGNICRSPTAEGIFRHRLSSLYPEAEINIDSAGTAGYHEGALADPRSRAAASARGYKLESRAAQFKTNDFNRFSLILAMDTENLRNLQAIAPSSFAGELRLYRDFDPQAESGASVPDPYYGGSRGFEDVLDMCERTSDGLIAYLTEIGEL